MSLMKRMARLIQQDMRMKKTAIIGFDWKKIMKDVEGISGVTVISLQSDNQEDEDYANENYLHLLLNKETVENFCSTYDEKCIDNVEISFVYDKKYKDARFTYSVRGGMSTVETDNCFKFADETISNMKKDGLLKRMADKVKEYI